MSDEYFGNQDQIALTKRGEALWCLLKDLTDYSFYGRMVSLGVPKFDKTLDVLTNLTCVQGASSCQNFPLEETDRFCEALKQRGLEPSPYQQYRGEHDAYRICKGIVSEHAIPSDLTLKQVNVDTSLDLIAKIAAFSLNCGVMPVPAAAMRGQVQPGLCLALIDHDGKPIATASSYLSNHPNSARAKDAFWGMLATDPERRGEGLGRLIGAHSICAMWEQHGAQSFNTGINAKNSASIALCSGLGVKATDLAFIGCTDPTAFSGAITR